MAEFKIGLDFSDGRLIEVLEKAFGAADRLDKKVDELQGQLNKGFPTANASKLSAEVDKTAKAATGLTNKILSVGAASSKGFSADAVSKLSAELTDVTSEIDAINKKTLSLKTALASGFSAEDVDRLNDEIDKTTSAIGRLEKKSEALKAKLASGLDEKEAKTLNEELERTSRATERLERKAQGLQGKLSQGFDERTAQKLTEQIDGAAAATARLEKKAQDLRAKLAGATEPATFSMGQLAKSIFLAFGAFEFGKSIVQGVGQSISSFATNTISLAGAAESAEANFTTFLGSASAAKDVLADLNKFAADTPFTQTQINGVAQSLIAFGVEAENLKPTLQTLGDLSGGNAEKFGDLARIFGQAKTTTKLYTEDLNQLAERGIPVLQELAAQNGITEEAVRKLASEGKIGFTDLEKAFASLTSEGGKFFGLMARQSQTFEGLRSTLEGNFEQLQASVGQLLLPTLKQLVVSTNEVISAVDTSNFKDIGFDLALSFEQFGDKFRPVIEAIRSGFGENILPALTRFRGAVEDVIVDVSGFFSKITEGGAATAFITSAIEAVSKAYAILADEIIFAGQAIGDIVGPILDALAPAFRAVLQAGTAVLEAFNGLSKTAPQAGGAFEALGKVAGFLATGLSVIVQLFAEAIKGVVGAGDAMRSTDPIIRAFGDAVNFLAKPFRMIIGLYKDAGEALGQFLGLTETESEKQARLLQENSAFIQKKLTDERDAYEQERDLRNENTAGEKKAVAEKRKVQAAAAAQTKAEREKAAKEAQKLEEDRASLQLALITDETKRQILAENARFDEQKKQTQTLFKGRDELNGLLQKAEIIHQKNLAEITQKAADEQAKVLEEQAKLRLSLFLGDAGKAEAAEDARFKKVKELENDRFKEQIDSLKASITDQAALNTAIEAATLEHQKNLEDGERQHRRELDRIKVSFADEDVAKATSVEDTRFKDQIKQLNEAFAGKQELNGLVEEAERQHQKNLDKIQFDAAAKRIADGAGTQKELAEAQVKLLEETQNRYLLELEKGGASEEQIAKAKEAFQLASQKLRLQNEIAYQQAILQTVAAGDEGQRKEIEAQIAVLQAQLGNVDFQINAPDDLGGGLLDKIKNLKKNIAEALNIPPGEFDKLVEGAVDAVGNAFNAISATTDAQIATNQAVIDSLNERISAQQEAVDKEKEVAEQGYANNLSGEQALLDGLLAQREAAEAKSKQLRDKALRLQLLQDTAQQVSNTAVSVTNIIKNTSTIPFVGILLAAIQIGSLFALLSASRQKAKAEAASTKFFKGGKIPMFRSDENGMRGNRIEGTNMEVGGNEFVVNRKVTSEHEPFLQRLNAGEYAGRDLEGAVGEGSNEKAPTRANKNVRTESHESRFERWADAQFREIVRERVLQSESTTIAKEAVTNQVAERVYKSTMSDRQRNFLQQIGMALPGSQVYKNVQMVESAGFYSVAQPGASVDNFYETLIAPAAATNLAQRLTERTREASDAVAQMTTASRDDQSGKIVAAVTQQTNDLIRRGLLPLMQLGHRIVDAEGNTVHYSTDASGNTRVSTLVS